MLCVRGLSNLESLKCLRSLSISEVNGFDEIEDFEDVTNLAFSQMGKHFSSS